MIHDPKIPNCHVNVNPMFYSKCLPPHQFLRPKRIADLRWRGPCRSSRRNRSNAGEKNGKPPGAKTDPKHWMYLAKPQKLAQIFRFFFQDGQGSHGVLDQDCCSGRWLMSNQMPNQEAEFPTWHSVRNHFPKLFVWLRRISDGFCIFST